MSIGKGEWHALIGGSGGGKSITALSIGDMLPADISVDSGSIQLHGRSLLTLSKKERKKLCGKELAYVFQDYTSAFTPFITLGKQMDETLREHFTLKRTERKKKIIQLLSEVNLPANRVYESYPFQLSGGQLQRASLAMAMMLEPQLLIADEPTTALDRANGEEILRLMSILKERTGCGILFITHDLRNVKRYADKVSIMHEGQVVESGETLSVLQRPDHDYTKSLLAAIPVLSDMSNRLLTSVNENYESKLHAQFTAEKGIEDYRSKELLTIKSMVKTYRKGSRALDGVSFTVKTGECLGLVGESGSGKSTLARCLLQLEETDAGETWFQGVPLHERNSVSSRLIRDHHQAVFQNTSAALNPRLKVIDSLMEPLDQLKNKIPSFLGDSKLSRIQVAERLLSLTGLSRGVLNQYPHELSGGQKQRVSIARAISIEPTFIVLDEPTSSLDTIIQAEILNLLKDLQEELGFSYLFISHESVCNSFYVQSGVSHEKWTSNR